MYNWNTNTSGWNKKSASYKIWSLEQLINFGLHGQKLNLRTVKKYWPKLQLDPYRKRFLELLIWPKLS